MTGGGAAGIVAARGRLGMEGFVSRRLGAAWGFRIGGHGEEWVIQLEWG